MSAVPVVKLLTVDEAREVAERSSDKRFELHHGQILEMPPPRFLHTVLQGRIYDLLCARAPSFGPAYMELGFRAAPEYDARRADIALLSTDRARKAVEADDVFGAPDLVIEVLSPSNRAGEMDEKEALCLARGCLSFWLVNPVSRTVRVTNPDRPVHWYGEGDAIPLAPFADSSIAVAEIFAPLT